MLGENRGVAVAERVQKASRALDVGEEQSDCAGGELPRGLHASRLRPSDGGRPRSSQPAVIETFVKSNWSSRFGSQPLTFSSLRITHVDQATGM